MLPVVVLRFTDEEIPVLRLVDEELVLRCISSSLPVLLPDECTAPDERELLPVITRTEELRLEPLSIRRVAPLSVRLAVVPVRDALVAELRVLLLACGSRRVAVPVAVRWFSYTLGPPPPHPGLPTPEPG